MSMTSDHTPSAGTPPTAPALPTVAVMSICALAVVGQLYATVPLIGDLAGAFGTTPAAAAWASTAFGLAYAIGMLIAGPVSDALGRRRVAVAGLLAGAAGALLVSASWGFVPLLLTRAVQGAATAFFPPVALAYLTERLAPHRRSIALTTVISSFLAAAILAPLTAQALSSLGGWRTWFHASALALLPLAALLSRVMLPDAGQGSAGAGDGAPATGGVPRLVAAKLAGMPALLTRPRPVALYVTTLSVMFTYVGVTTLAQLAGPGTAGQPGVMQAVRAATLPACAIVPAFGAALARVPGPRRLVAGIVLTAVAAIAVGTTTGPITLTVALGALTIGVAATAPALVETIGQTSPPDHRGAATALYGFVLFVGASLAAPAATFAAGHPYPTAAAGFAAVAALGTVGALIGTRPSTVSTPPRRTP